MSVVSRNSHGEVEDFNMFQNDVIRQYKENSIHTTRPEDLTLMLYNGLIKFLMKADIAVRENNYEDVNYYLLRSQDIVNEFISTLDMKYDVSKGLVLMYDYIVRRLVEANMKKDKEIIAEIMGYSKELRDTWQAAMKIAKTEQANQCSQTNQPNQEIRTAK